MARPAHLQDKAMRIWIHNDSRGTYLIDSEETFWDAEEYAGGDVCHELGQAVTGTKEELKQLLRKRGLTETQITIETAGVADGQTTNRSNTMTTELMMIPNAADVPAYLRNPELARQANEEAAAGIGTGFPPRVKLNGKAFALVDGNGDETSIPPDKMFAGPDQMYLPMIVLRAKKALQKTWYATAFNPASEPVAPDCFSTDYERPDPSASAPQSEVCANCPMNAYGSGKDQAGNPTAGKACADTKVLAVFVPGFGIYSIKIPPASLKNFGLYVKQLSAAGIPLGTVKTMVGFDMTATFPVLVFKFGGYLPEASLDKLAEMSLSPEVEEIVGVQPVAAPKKAIAAPAPAPAPEPKQEPLQDDDPLGLNAAPATPDPKVEAAAKAAAKAKAAAADKAAKAAAAADKAAKAAAAAAEAAAPQVQSVAVSDEDLMAQLGL